MARGEAKTIDLGKGSVGKLLFRLALPAVVAQIINMLYNIVDRMFVGSIPQSGTNALAGLGVCFPILIFVSAFSMLIGMGGAPLAAIKLGEKNKDEAETIMNVGLVLLVGIGIILTVLISIFSRPLLQIFGAPPTALSYADDYLKIYAIGTVFVMLSLGLNSYITTQGYAMTAMITVAVGAVLNIALDPLFIYVFDMGVKGAALATVISQFVSFVWVLVFFISKRSKLRINPKKFKLKKRIVLPMLALGLSPFIMQVTDSAVQIVFNIQIHNYTGGAEEYTAALTIMMSVMQMVSLPLNGLGTGAQPLISYNYGAGNMDRIKKAVIYIFIVAAMISFTIWLMCLVSPWLFAKMFSASDAVTVLVVKYMPVFMMGSVMFCSQFTLQSAFVALRQAKISIFLAMLRKVILLIPLTFVIPLFIGIDGVFLAEGISDITAGIVTTLCFALSYRHIIRRREKEIANSLLTDNPTNVE